MATKSHLLGAFPKPTAVILAGGLGTRLRQAVDDRPKILAEVLGRPFVCYVLDQIQAAGCTRVIFSIGYRGDQVERTIGAEYASMTISYIRDPFPLGTGGALRHVARSTTDDDFLVLNGDSLATIDIKDFVAWRHSRKFDKAVAILRVENCARFGVVRTDENDEVLEFAEKTGREVPGWINSGIYLMRRRDLAELKLEDPFSLERDVFPQWISGSFGARKLTGHFIDIGTPESLAGVAAFFVRRGEM